MVQAVNLVEVFSSIQGEGLFVGCRQVFVRLAGCNLSCHYCDTPASRGVMSCAQVEAQPGQRQFITMQNPVDITLLATRINQLLVLPHHSVSLTGGEPLLQWEAIVKLAPLVNGQKYLETNGILYQELEMVLPHIDIISMDIKLPSAGKTEYWVEHKSFLQTAAAKKVFVKIVITAETNVDEFEYALNLIKTVGRHIPLILQPVSPNSLCRAAMPETMLSLQEKALRVLEDVRVIPQTHKFMGQL